QQRIAARRNRLDARRRNRAGEPGLRNSRQVLAKLLFHGTQLVTNVQVESDLREWRRREKEGPEKLRRLEKLETEAKRGAEKLAEINSRWGSAEELKVPQELWELLEQQQEQCQQLLAEKNQLIQELRQELQARDEQYEQALKEQAEEIRLLLERMEEQTRNMLRTYRHHLRQIEKTFEEERREMLANNRKRWNEAIRAHNEQELEFLRHRMEQAREFEQQLNELQAESVESYDRMKFQLEQDVQYLEKKLRQMKGMFHLNQVKLEYNLDVLRQLDLENSTLRSLQKRKITRFQTCLSLLRERMARQEEKFQEEKRSLEWELQRITGQFQETRSRMRQLAQSSAERFRQVWIVNEEEAKALIRQALDADRIIHVQQLGIPWEEPRLGLLENVGPLGGRREKRDALQVATELLEGWENPPPKNSSGFTSPVPSHPWDFRVGFSSLLPEFSRDPKVVFLGFFFVSFPWVFRDQIREKGAGREEEQEERRRGEEGKAGKLGAKSHQPAQHSQENPPENAGAPERGVGELGIREPAPSGVCFFFRESLWNQGWECSVRLFPAFFFFFFFFPSQGIPVGKQTPEAPAGGGGTQEQRPAAPIPPGGELGSDLPGSQHRECAAGSGKGIPGILGAASRGSRGCGRAGIWERAAGPGAREWLPTGKGELGAREGIPRESLGSIPKESLEQPGVGMGWE
uniref:Dynein regulatory complex subunit 1 n=1 Tax=Cyanistes caeruleus TaxID=156563 RepID=A0A8C0VJ49_CYACU